MFILKVKETETYYFMNLIDHWCMLWMCPGHGTTFSVHQSHTENIQNKINQSKYDQCKHIPTNTCNKSSRCRSSVSLSFSLFSFFQEISPHLNPWFHMLYMGMLGIIIAFLFAAWQHTGYNLVLTHAHTQTVIEEDFQANKLHFKQFSLKANLWAQISFVSIWSSSQAPQRWHFNTNITL